MEKRTRIPDYGKAINSCKSRFTKAAKPFIIFCSHTCNSKDFIYLHRHCMPSAFNIEQIIYEQIFNGSNAGV